MEDFIQGGNSSNLGNGSNLGQNWIYIFEDDINLSEDISLDEIVKYEAISDRLFLLGLCELWPNRAGFRRISEPTIRHPVVNCKRGIRGFHAVAFSYSGAAEFVQWSKRSNEKYLDVILQAFCEKYTANVVRYDLQSRIKGHRGVFFQDRERFPSTIPSDGGSS